MKEEYETTICREFSIPYVLYKTELIIGSSKSESGFHYWDSLFRDSVKTIQQLYTSIFDFLYKNTFLVYDKALIESVKNNPKIKDLLINNNRKKSNLPRLRLEFDTLQSEDNNSIESNLQLWDRGLIQDDDIVKNHERIYGKSLNKDDKKNKKNSSKNLISNNPASSVKKPKIANKTKK